MIIITERLREPGILILQRVLVLFCLYVTHASGIRHARNSGLGRGGINGILTLEWRKSAPGLHLNKQPK